MKYLLHALLCCMLAAGSAHAVHPQREEARRLVDARQYPPAIDLYRNLVERFPDDTDLLIEAARVEGFADHNAQAADLYERALRSAPARRSDILPSLAWQSLWAGRHEQAAALFRERMSSWSDAASVADSRRGLGEALLGAARAHVAAQDYPAALEVYARLAEVERADAARTAEVARVLGYADRNTEAAATYRRAIELAPERRGEWLLPLAWQTLWSGDAAAGRTLFSEAQAAGIDLPDTWRGVASSCAALDRHPCAVEAWRKVLEAKPDDVDARRGLARALLWSDQYTEAESEYATLLAADPQDEEARLGLAQVKNFSGRHRAAVREFDRIDSTTDEGLRVARARALYWAGYADEALPLLDTLQDPDARWLRDFRIRRETQHYASAGIDWSEDADRLRIVTPYALAGWRRSPDETFEIGLRLPQISGYEVGTRSPRRSIDGSELSASWGLRIGEVRSGSGTLWPTFTLGRRDYDGWQSTAWRARLRYVPTDLWRIDAEAGNGIIDTVSALRNEVSYRDLSLGAQYTPSPRWSFAGSIAHLQFDDDNRRNRIAWRADYALWTRPRILLGIEGNRFENSRPWDVAIANRGYYNPDHYLEYRLFTALYNEVRPWSYYLKAALGRYSETDGDGNRASGRNYLLEGWVAYDLGPGWQLRAAAGLSDSEAGSPGGGSGYWRRFGSIMLNAWF
jgi:tetratricopeptide (TPR) repeat protein